MMYQGRLQSGLVIWHAAARLTVSRFDDVACRRRKRVSPARTNFADGDHLARDGPLEVRCGDSERHGQIRRRLHQLPNKIQTPLVSGTASAPSMHVLFQKSSRAGLLVAMWPPMTGIPLDHSAERRDAEILGPWRSQVTWLVVPQCACVGRECD